MNERIRVVVIGTGQMGLGIIRLCLQKARLQLVGVCARRPERAGIDVGALLGTVPMGLAVDHDLPALLDRVKPHVIIQATCSKAMEAEKEIDAALNHGANVISIAEEMVFPACQAPEIAQRIHRLALAQGRTVLGTGINPGFVLDLLVITLTGVCQRVESIRARRMNDLSPYGPTVLKSQGVGLTQAQFEQGVRDGSIAGHFGFPQSIHLTARALGWNIDCIDQMRKPIISTVKRETPFVTVQPGCAAGCLHTAIAYRDKRPVIELIHPQQVRPELENVKTGDMIEIRGVPDIKLEGSPEIPGGVSTVALAVNMVPLVVAAAPGLKTMADLPVPRAMA